MVTEGCNTLRKHFKGISAPVQYICCASTHFQIPSIVIVAFLPLHDNDRVTTQQIEKKTPVWLYLLKLNMYSINLLEIRAHIPVLVSTVGI